MNNKTLDIKEKLSLCADLNAHTENLQDIGEVILSLSKNEIVTNYLLLAYSDENTEVNRLLFELQKFGIKSTQEAINFFIAHKKD